LPYVIETHSLTKKYGPKALAVSSLEIQVESREIFGLLGPNGAGKTTTVKMLTTLLRPTSGSAVVGGWDVVRNARTVRRVINYLPQQVTADDTITGYENLLFYAKLYKLAKESRDERIWEALDLVGLREKANELAGSYSGGMKRRLELASVLVSGPQILFLDEPTLGLDPRSRAMIWDFLLRMRDRYNTTIFVTTNYMDEADKLCDRVAIIDAGMTVVEGRPSELKSAVGGDIVSMSTDANERTIDQLVNSLDYVKRVEFASGSVKLLIEGKSGEEVIPTLLSEIKALGSNVDSVTLQKASLDDVFAAHTHKTLDQEAAMGGPMRLVNRARLLKARRS